VAPARRAGAIAVAVSLVLSTAVWSGSGEAGAAATGQSYAVPASGTIQVVGHGNGHGHGLSQYGAYGAALAGLTYEQILAFYYPGTALKAIPSSTILRVKISGGYGYTCIQNKTGLSVVGSTAKLPAPTAARSPRFLPSGAGILIRGFTTTDCSGGSANRLPAATDVAAGSSASVQSKDGFVRLMLRGGWTDYWGQLGAVRSGSGELTINKVDLDHYAQGVAPRESPASWGVTALSAQAVAARTYAEYEREHAGSGSLYDICDTPSCQVYGGKEHSGSGGLWSDYPDAVANNKGQVLTYKGAVAFTQYSASNGGRTADGGQPYMIAKADPYDNARSGDPYLNTTRTVAVTSLAAAFGFKTVTAIDITGRDGGTTGYVTSAVVYGTNAAGTSVSKATTGYTLQSVFGLNSTYFTIASAGAAPAATPPAGAPSGPPPGPPANITSYVTTVHRTLTGVAPSRSALLSESGTLLAGTTAAAYARSIAQSGAALQREVRLVYAATGHKAPGAATLAAKVKTIKTNGYLAFEVAQFAAGGFYRKVGGTPSKWVRAVYRSGLVYDKAPTAATVTKWAKKLKRGVSRSTVARQILTSGPVSKYVVRTSAREVLGRKLTPTELAAWSRTLVRSGYSPANLMAAGLSLAEVRKHYALKR